MPGGVVIHRRLRVADRLEDRTRREDARLDPIVGLAAFRRAEGKVLQNLFRCLRLASSGLARDDDRLHAQEGAVKNSAVRATVRCEEPRRGQAVKEAQLACDRKPRRPE